MKTDEGRRQFLKEFSKVGVSCFSLAMWYSPGLADESNQDGKEKKVEPIELKKRSYCGIACETECELYKATQENNTELKKKVYDKWNWKEQFGIEFDPDKVFCYNCKPESNVYKMGMLECEVRKCAMKNEMDACIQCKNLTSCDKEFWSKWSHFYDHVKNLQKQYMNQEGSKIKDVSQL